MKKKTDDIWSSWKVCKLFSISRASLSKWRGRGCPWEKWGYDIFEVFSWYQKNIISDPGVETNLAQEKLLRERAKRKLDELKAAKERGSLIEKSLAYSWLGQMIVECKSNFLTLPRRLAEQLAVEQDPKMVETILRGELRQILTTLAEGKKKSIPQNSRRR